MRPLAVPPDWPLRDASRHVACRPHLWHLADLGEGPVLLALHGAGGAGHSWRGLAPLLARRFRVIAPDLPGQGFSSMGSRLRLAPEALAADLAALLAQQRVAPAVLLGHSAGAALALELARILPESPRAVVGINAALSPFAGVAGILFPLMARLLAVNPLVPPVVARLLRRPGQTERLLAATGSRLEPAGIAAYRRLVGDLHHVDATLAMVAQWRLEGIARRLQDVAVPTLLVTAAGDRAVPPAVSAAAAARMPAATHLPLAGYGHLVHEEAPEAVAAAILSWLDAFQP